jgi:glycosyltransferase involved in cell wall biosynthesis
MKVGLVTFAYPINRNYYWIGVERSVEAFAKALIKEGIEVTVFCSKINGVAQKEKNDENLKILQTNAISKGILNLNVILFTFYTYHKYFEELKKQDIIHIFASSHFPIFKNKFNKIITHVFHEPILSDQSFPLLIQTIYQRAYNYFLYKLSDVISVEYLPGTYEWNELIKIYNLRNDKVIFSPVEGVDLNVFNDKVECKDIVEKYGNDYILAVGPFRVDKGYNYMIRAIPLVIKEVKDAHFLFVGSTKNIDYLFNLINRLGINDKITFTGFVHDNMLPKFYRAAKFLVFPALREGMPLIPLEAMACGTPVISSDLPITRYELGNAGIFVKPRDPNAIAKAIIELLNDDNLRKELSRRGLERVKKFTWENCAKNWIKLYQKILNEDEEFKKSYNSSYSPYLE